MRRAVQAALVGCVLLLCLGGCDGHGDGEWKASPLSNDPARGNSEPGGNSVDAASKFPDLAANESGGDGSVIKIVDAAGRIQKGNRITLAFTTFPIRDDEQRQWLTDGGGSAMASGFRIMGHGEVFIEIGIKLKNGATALSKANVEKWYFMMFNYTELQWGDEYDGGDGFEVLEGDLKKGGVVKVRLSKTGSASGNSEVEHHYYFKLDRSVKLHYAPKE
ncbi:MAG: hypothetical protein KDB82_11430 [Planctomycetes bacterium]|mgnify:CR=1 FL=1|nr:hypothetical protein [Planctomycetota bacterium]